VKHLRRRGKKGRKKEGKREEALGANKGNGEQKRRFCCKHFRKIYKWGKGQNIIHHYGNDIPMYILRFEI